MSFAKDMQAMATELLSEFDERTGDNRIMLVKPGEKIWDDVEGEYIFGPETRTPLTGVAVQYDESTIDGTTIQAGDIKLILTNAIEITASSRIILDEKEYSVVMPNASAYTGKDLTIVYKVQLRG